MAIGSILVYFLQAFPFAILLYCHYIGQGVYPVFFKEAYHIRSDFPQIAHYRPTSGGTKMVFAALFWVSSVEM